MLIQDIIAKKRDNKTLTNEEIHWFISNYCNNKIPDYQAAALIMAIFINGFTKPELASFTHEMLHSGIVVDLSSLNGLKVDKHSTGGVGDKISIPLAPLVASCGIYVPMVSGRGLGHTGGTLDKLEAIPGFNVNISIDNFKRIIGEIGMCMMGQTKDLAPADKLIYSLRDATGTVPSIPLISSSIMSKKLAEGIDALVLDVKVGTGAFMPTLEKAEVLAQTLVDIGTHSNKKVTAFLTRMDDPLGKAVGNANEIIESIEVLKGRGPSDVTKLTYTFAEEMLILGGIAKNYEEASKIVKESIDSGKALKKMAQMIEKQGGNPEIIENYDLLPKGANKIEIKSKKSGYITGINSTEIGNAGVLLGAGRKIVSDKVDHGVSIEIFKKTNDEVKIGDILVTVEYNNDSSLEEAKSRIFNAYSVGDEKVEIAPLIYKKIESK
jgi:pyrimidine-nucleoside phosphorylase